MIDENELTRRVAESFRAHAVEVTLADEPFDPTRRLPQPLAEVTGGRRGRALLLAAAVTVVAGLGATAWLVEGDGGRDDPTTVTPSMHTPPTDVLAPTEVPDGWVATRAQWSEGLLADPFVGDSLDHGERAQLFGDPNAPTRGLLVESDGRLKGEAFPDGTDVTVRGVPAGAQTVEQQTELRFWPTGVAFLEWSENGHTFRASYRGMTRDEAIAIVDDLRPRTPDLTAGFDLGPTAGGLALVQEVLDPTTETDHVGLVYEPQHETALVGPYLTVGTSAAVGRPTVAYLGTRLAGEVAADGTATAWDPRGWLRLARPDGTLVDVSLQTLVINGQADPEERNAYDIPGVGSAAEVARQVAESVQRISPDDFGDLDHSTQLMAADKPLLASVELPSGTLEVRGRVPAEGFCLIVGQTSRCTQHGESFTIDGVMFGELVIDGQRYAIGASQDRPPTIRLGDAGTVVAGETGNDAGWHVAIAAVALDEAVNID